MAKKTKAKKTRGAKNLGRPATLTPKEMRVIDEYFLNGFVKTDALASQGYGTPHTNTYEFFNRPLVKAEIAKRENAARRKFEVSQDTIIQELAAIGFARLSTLLDIQPDGSAVINLLQMTEAERAAIAEFTVEEYQDGKGDDARDVKKIKVKLHDKNGALDKLARHLGLYKDKVEVGGDADIVALLLAGRTRAAQDPIAPKA